MSDKETKNTKSIRQPVVAVMGHIDHGKSTLLDYIRKANVTAGEAGGITQHISAYEAVVKDEKGEEKRITFLDTPGHEAFRAMRTRGASAADIAILVVAANDGVKTQTKEALSEIKNAGIPFVVAINKIDLPNADVGKTKNTLVENEVYIEGYGGSVPAIEISAKEGKGIEDLLQMILLVTELEELSCNLDVSATGVVLEANIDPQKGTSATLILKDGKIKSGQYVVAGASVAPTRIMEDFAGHKIKEAVAGQPVRIVGFSSIPQVGETFEVIDGKKDAESKAGEYKLLQDELEKRGLAELPPEKKGIPVVIKTDAAGTRDAVLDEIGKITHERAALLILDASTGAIGENDVRVAGSSEGGIIIGFGARPDSSAKRQAEQLGVELKTFSIIYELTDWLKDVLETRAPKVDVEEGKGRGKVLKLFSRMKNKQVLGIRAEEGTFKKGDTMKIMRRDFEVGKATMLEIRRGKEEVTSLNAPDEFGARVESKIEIVPGDYLEPFSVVKK